MGVRENKKKMHILCVSDHNLMPFFVERIQGKRRTPAAPYRGCKEKKLFPLVYFVRWGVGGSPVVKTQEQSVVFSFLKISWLLTPEDVTYLLFEKLKERKENPPDLS